MSYFTRIHLPRYTRAQAHAWIANIDNKAIWQKNGDIIYMISNVKLTNSKEVDTNFAVGTILDFFWEARPVYKDLNTKQSRCIKDKMHMDRYLKNRFSSGGFEFVDEQVSSTKSDFVFIEHKNLNIYRKCFYGKLRVTDTEKFSKTLSQGVSGKNSCKCYGFSMINIWVD